MAVTINGSTGITMPAEGLSPSALGNGGIIQAVDTGLVASFNTDSTSYVDITDATISITPRTNTNKILIMWTCYTSHGLVSSSNAQTHFKLLRDSTKIHESAHSAESSPGGLQTKMTCNMIVPDNPTTASAITYKRQMKTTHASSNPYIWEGRLTALEIVA